MAPDTTSSIERDSFVLIPVLVKRNTFVDRFWPFALLGRLHLDQQRALRLTGILQSTVADFRSSE